MTQQQPLVMAVSDATGETAQQTCRAALAQFGKTLEEEAEWMLRTRSALGDALLRQGRLGEAEELLQPAYEGLKDQRRVETFIKRRALERVVRLHEALGRSAEAKHWRSELEARAGLHDLAIW